jgi:hypothetical protein
VSKIKLVDVLPDSVVGSQDPTNEDQQGQKAFLVDRRSQERGKLVDWEGMVLFRQSMHDGCAEAQEHVPFAVLAWACLEVPGRQCGSLGATETSQVSLNRPARVSQ